MEGDKDGFERGFEREEMRGNLSWLFFAGGFVLDGFRGEALVHKSGV